jgi:hypothetical protein
MENSLVSWASRFKVLQTQARYLSGKPSSTRTCSQTPNFLSSSLVSSTTKTPRLKSQEGCSRSVEQILRCIKATLISRVSPRQRTAARSGYRPYPVRLRQRHCKGSSGPVFAGVTVNGKAVNIGTQNTAAIDTGTTLIGGPTAAVDAIWAAVPNSAALSGNMTGFFSFRACLPSWRWRTPSVPSFIQRS